MKVPINKFPTNNSTVYFVSVSVIYFYTISNKFYL
jgi:hypothetical protein